MKNKPIVQKHFLGFLIFLFVCLFFFHACRKEHKSSSWDVDALAPLVKSTLTLNNIITDSLLIHNPDNSLNIVYNISLNSFSYNSIFQIPDTTINVLVPLGLNTTISPCSTIGSINDSTIYPLQDVKLIKAIIRSGKMVIFITNNTDGNLEVNYTIPLATLNNKPFDVTFIVPKRSNSTTPGVYSKTFDMSGYNFDLRGLSGGNYNTIVKRITVKLPCSDPVLTLNGVDYIQMENSFLGIVPQYAKGYFGSTTRHIVGNTDVSLFKHIIGGKLDLQSVNIGLSIENSVGDDARITIDTLSSINSRTGVEEVLTHSIIGSPININRAADMGGNVIPSTYSVSFTPGNSNIIGFIDNLPNKLKYAFDLEINPFGSNVSGNNDFVYYGKYINTDLNMTIPLSLIANNLTMADTLNFNLPASVDNVNSGNIYLHAENGFPFTAEPKLYLMDASLHVVDSLLCTPNLILAPQLNANFICVGKKLTILTFPLNERKLSSLRAARKLYIKMKFNTTGQPAYVKIYSFYEMNIKLVGDFNYTVGKK